MPTSKNDKSSCSKRLKYEKAKVARRDKKIEELNAKIAQYEEELKKKANAQVMGQARQNIEKQSQATNTQSSLSDFPSLSDAKRDAALEILLRLLKS